MNISKTTAANRVAPKAAPAAATATESDDSGASITIDFSSIGSFAGKALRGTAGAASLVLHAPQVAVGPLLTGGARDSRASNKKAVVGYGLSYGLSGAAVAGTVAYSLGAGVAGSALIGGVAGAFTGLFTAMGVDIQGKGDSNLAKVSRRRHEAYHEIEGPNSKKTGYAIAQGYREAAGLYYETGASTVDGVIGFVEGLGTSRPE